MKTEFKAKFLQHLQKRKQDKGFTLIELLVVIIIIGILSAIALPSFLNQANKAKESEAKQYAGSMNRAQQAKVAEVGGFISDINLLGLGIKTQTSNFTYTIVSQTNQYAGNQAIPIVTALRAYTGSVVLSGNTATSESTTVAVLCVTKATTQSALGAVTNPAAVSCTGDSEEVKK
ncbi:type IV pilin-like G/H family protein [Microcoleus sp. herbarium12]|uniref:type IV pilin-like G/H family protein n=1 Tax=Microcoleus sp. herbarium12 TaxID=3055437 RepID=UPI002FD52B55